MTRVAPPVELPRARTSRTPRRSLLARLNEPQRRAVTTLSGPLLVLAGAGSGKTRVITYRIVELISADVLPRRILAVTFTNKAAQEMRERVSALLRPRRSSVGTTTPEISTFHSLAVRILRRHIRRLGYPENFSIYDRGDQESVARNALRDVRVDDKKLRPAELLHRIGRWKQASVDPRGAQETAGGDHAALAAIAYERYQTALRSSGAVDFDDLLMLTEELFTRFPEVRFAESSRFDHVLVDEYQDTNAIQYRILRALAERHQNLCVVGDDDQAIYGWRGADVSHILRFPEDWANATLIRLEENYRSRPPILELANRLILHNSARHAKTLKAVRNEGRPPRFLRYEDEVLEAEGVVRDIAERLGSAERLESTEVPRTRPKDIAVLCRTNEQPRLFELELRRRRIPYVLVGGPSFYDRKETRDVLSYLKVLANPRDEVALLRIINTPARGIGPARVAALLEHAVKSGKNLWDVLESAEAGASAAATQPLRDFRRLIERFRVRLGSTGLADLATELISVVDYRSELERSYENPRDVESRWDSVQALVNAMAQYEAREEAPSLIGFLEETLLAGREDLAEREDAREADALTLMTLHSAKGLEFPHVYMVGMEEGILPHQRSVKDGAIAEERRLCYVGITRAEETLTISFARGRMKWGKLEPALPSRFVMEMRGESDRAERIALAAAARFADAEPPSKTKAAKSQGKPRRRDASSKGLARRAARPRRA